MSAKLEKTVAEAVQTFREAQNLLPTLHTHLLALENIMTQKAALAGAVRRRSHCFATPSSSIVPEDAEDFGEEVSHATGGRVSTAILSTSLNLEEDESPRCTHTTTAVATAPMGVLAAFPVSAAHHLIAQHQRDETELLGVISRVTQQSWPQKVEQLKAKIALVEKGPADEGSARQGSASVLKGGPLLSTAQILVALYGLLACAVKMGSVLQEVTLALRHDTRDALLSNAASSDGAAGLADHLAGVFAREGELTSADGALLSMHDSFSGPGAGVRSGAVARERTFRRPPEPLPLLEAVGMLDDFIKGQWHHCRDVFLPEESHWLLVNG